MKQNTLCNICKQVIPAPLHPGRNIFYLREYELCEACNDDLNLALERDLKVSQQPLDFETLNQMQTSYLRLGEEAGHIRPSQG